MKARSIPFKNTTFQAVSGWEKGKGNGISEMFHFRANCSVVGHITMARRIACACPSCTETLDAEWIAGVHPRDQPAYKKPPSCVFAPMMKADEEDLNKWHFVQLAPIEGKCNDDELDEFFTSVMAQRTKEVESEIEVGGTGALASDTEKKEHGFHLIEWTSVPYILQEPKKVFGIKDPVASGNVVCEGVFLQRIDHSKDWYEPQESTPSNRPKKIVVLLQHVLSGSVFLKPYCAFARSTLFETLRSILFIRLASRTAVLAYTSPTPSS